jgi:hypothetical protein
MSGAPKPASATADAAVDPSSGNADAKLDTSTELTPAQLLHGEFHE